MHELGIATEIYRSCRRRMAEHPAGRLETVKVAIGELAGVEPDLLRYAWEAVVQGGPDQGAVLEVEWHAAWETCGSCGHLPERGARGWFRICDRCGKMLHVKGGHEMDLLRFTFVPDREATDHVHGSRSR